MSDEDNNNVPEYRKPLTHRLDQRFFDSIVLNEPQTPHQTPPNPQKVLAGPQKSRERGDKNSGRNHRFDGPRHNPKERKNMEHTSQSPNGQPTPQTPVIQMVRQASPVGESVLTVLAVGATVGVLYVSTYAACLGIRKLMIGA